MHQYPIYIMPPTQSRETTTFMPAEQDIDAIYTPPPPSLTTESQVMEDSSRDVQTCHRRVSVSSQCTSRSARRKGF